MASTIPAQLLRWLMAGSGVLLLFTAPACNRTWHRLDADKEAAALIQEKEHDPKWACPGFTVDVDPRSRFYDATDPDHSPMPPDDPDSHRYMHCVYGMRGAKSWHEAGVRGDLENPDWRMYLGEFLECTPDDRYKLTLDGALQLAYLHSPQYQSQLEEVYLTALDLAFERFRFDVQFFGGFDSFFTHTGKLGEPGPGGGRGVSIPPLPTGVDSNTVSTAAGVSAHKLFPTGAELAVGFANSFLWQFAGPNTEQTISLLHFNLIQPLLRLGGREVVLERLTRVERGLLANLRALGRYRETFYAQVAMGEGARGGPKRAGGFLGGAGLDEGFTGTGVGGFGAVGDLTGFGRPGGEILGTAGGTAGFAGGGAGLAGGFLGLAQLQQELRHREANVAHILRELERMEANFQAGRIDAFQVDQFRQSVQTQLSLLLQAQRQFETQVDAYLVGLGLPPDVPVAIDDGIVKQFEFFAPALATNEQRATDMVKRLRQMSKPALAELQEIWQEAERLQGALIEQNAAVGQDLVRLESLQKPRLGTLTKDADRVALAQEIQGLRATWEQLQQEIADAGEQLQNLKALLKPETAAKLQADLEDFADGLAEQLTELSLVQARARLETVIVKPVDLTAEEAFCIARENRLDWMNQRAALVDQWRLIGFNADRLESDFDVIVTGDLLTHRDDPLDFRGKTGSLSAGFRFDAPLTRKAERNQYREALINFQAVRRGYIQYEDSVHQTLRLHLRTLSQARENLEMQRKSCVIALRAFNLTRLRLRQPPPPAQVGQPMPGGAQFGPTAARDLLGALSDLLGAQNNFMSVWVQYETARMMLYRDLGIMKFNERGAWVDEPLECYLEEVRAKAPGGSGPPISTEAAPEPLRQMPAETPE